MPVLYGVFLYMGVSSLKGIQVCLRLSLSCYVLVSLCLSLTSVRPAAVRSDQTVRHAGQTPAGPDLPALRPSVEGPHLHRGAAVLPHRPLVHQGVVRRRRLPHDGETNTHDITLTSRFLQNIDMIMSAQLRTSADDQKVKPLNAADLAKTRLFRAH